MVSARARAPAMARVGGPTAGRDALRRSDSLRCSATRRRCRFEASSGHGGGRFEGCSGTRTVETRRGNRGTKTVPVPGTPEGATRFCGQVRSVTISRSLPDPHVVRRLTLDQYCTLDYCTVPYVRTVSQSRSFPSAGDHVPVVGLICFVRFIVSQEDRTHEERSHEGELGAGEVSSCDHTQTSYSTQSCDSTATRPV